MEELNRRKEILKVIHCFKGPIHKAFVYVYYQTYTQDTDTYNYALNSEKDFLFSPTELEYLKNERRPEHLKLSLLYKVLRTCCSPSLAHYEDTLWFSNGNLEKCSTANKTEEILGSLTNSYKDFLHKAHHLAIQDVSHFIEALDSGVSVLIQKAAEYSNSQRWMEERDRLKEIFAKVKNGDFLSCTKSVSELVKMEAEFRTDLYAELLSQELKSAAAFSWDLEVIACNQEGEIIKDDDEPREKIEAESIFEVVSEKQRRVCWIAGEHGVGKSSFAAFIASTWVTLDERITDIKTIGVVIVTSLSEFQADKCGDDILNLILPLTSLVVTKEKLQQWLQEENILIIFDDVNKHSEKIVKEIYEKVACAPNLMVWFVGRLSSVMKYTTNPVYVTKAILFELKGLKEERVLILSEAFEAKGEHTLKARLKQNMNRLGPVLKYPTITYWTQQLWQGSPHVFKDVYTASDLMWEILAWKVKAVLKINIKKIGKIRKKFLNWLMLAGELALYSLKADLRLDKESLQELELEIVKLFTENGKAFLDSLFKPTIIHSFTTCVTTMASTSKPFLEYFSSWFFIDQLINNKQMSQLTNGLVNQLPLILFAAGHLVRFQEEGTITVPDERKVIKALINYREDSFEDFNFIQKFVAELKCIKRLVGIVIDETEYNEEWNLNTSLVQQRSLEVLLNHVSPTRLIFLADESKKNYELTSVMSYVRRVDISVWLDSAPQFMYGNKEKMDKLLKPFFEERVATRVDLICGFLSSSVMKELSKSQATQHLVLLRLKVSTEKELNVALSLPKRLTQLLWLEVKLDLKLSEIEIANVRSTKVALFDVHMRRIDNLDVPFLSELLTAMHVRFTGIHLEDTDFTPEGVFTLLKELTKRGVSFRADDESIHRFRRWYYPALSALPKGTTLTEEETLDLIGHDDRDFFSDHHVSSSRFVRAIDAWNLRTYLESRKNIVHFLYETSNIVFTKTLEGDVDITFKGDYKETIEENLMDSGGDGNSEIVQQVMDLC